MSLRLKRRAYTIIELILAVFILGLALPTAGQIFIRTISALQYIAIRSEINYKFYSIRDDILIKALKNKQIPANFSQNITVNNKPIQLNISFSPSSFDIKNIYYMKCQANFKSRGKTANIEKIFFLPLPFIDKL